MTTTPTKTICGRPVSLYVYAMASASLIESVVFITLYAKVISDINEYRNSIADLWNPHFVTDSGAIGIAIFCIALCSIRGFFAIIALIGQYMETIKTIAPFMVFTFLGLFGNVSTGIIGLQFSWTASIAIGTLATTGLHILYIALGIYVYRLEYNTMLEGQLRVPVIPGHVPYAMPVQTTINVLPTAPNPQVMSDQQPYMAPAPQVYYAHVPLAPPSYEESNSSGSVVQFVPPMRADDKPHKGEH